MTNSPRKAGKRASSTERAGLLMTSGAHFVHDGVADSLYVLLPMWAQAFALNSISAIPSIALASR